MQKKLYTSSPFFLFSYLPLQLLFGIAVLNGWLLFAVMTLSLLFAWHRRTMRLRLRLPMVFFGNIIFMMVVASWFRNIDAFGWQSIGPFDPNLMLMLVLLVISAFCSIFIALLWLAAERGFRWSSLRSSALSYIYVWAVVMMLAEIVRTASFSAFVSHSQAPVEPSLNLFSVGPLVHGTILAPLSRLFGFWGSSFLVFAAAGSLYVTLKTLYIKRTQAFLGRHAPKAAAVLAGMALLYVLAGINVGGKGQPLQNLTAIAVSQQKEDTAYLQRLGEQLRGTPKDKPTLVVLPEYSNLLHPYAGTSPGSATYNALDELPAILDGRPVYFVGTEDELSPKGRYVETYVADAGLKKIKRSEKTFLIPGGEYIPPRIGNVLKRIDAYAVINFSESQSRKVLGQPLPVEKTDPFEDYVATGPCSAILTPFHFRKQAAEGAVVLTSNVSYEQFAGAPEYQAYTDRFARFTAYSTAKPFIVGARAGAAVIYDEEGGVAASSEDSLTATHTFGALSQAKTLYVLLGDTLVVGVLVSIALALMRPDRLLAIRIRNKKENA